MELLEITAQYRQLRVEVMPLPHIHAEVEVNLVTGGAMTYRFGGETVTLPERTLVLFWGMTPHQTIAVVEPTSYVCLYLSMASVLTLPIGDAFRRALLSGRVLAASRVDAIDGPLFTRWHEDLDAADPRRAELARAELTSRIRRAEVDGWRDLTAGDDDPPKPVDSRRFAKAQAMARFVALHLGRPLSVAEIAGAAGLHPNYAMSVFKESLGLTVGQFVVRQRLGQAQAMLLATDHDVTRIAFDAGFGSLSRFYDAFTRQFGVAPQTYRHRYRAFGCNKRSAEAA